MTKQHESLPPPDYEADAEVLKHFEEVPTIEKATSDFFGFIMGLNSIPKDFFDVCNKEFADSIDATGRKLLQKNTLEEVGGISEFVAIASAETNDRLLRELKAYAATLAIIKICSGQYARVLREG